MKNYLKYWRVVRHFIKAKYGLTQSDLEMLLFLRSEKYFAKADFDEFNELFGWERDRFERLRKDGWIESFRKKDGSKKAIYQLSYRAQRMCHSVYTKLEGEEIPESKTSNPMFLANVSYTDKVYRNYIKKMNQKLRSGRIKDDD
jgi:hypothetical protein